MERRQSMDCYKEQKVLVDFQRLPGELVLTIRDEGPGFNCQCYLDFDPERAAHPHGRGIAMACAFNLENVEYIGTGNTVRIRIKTPVKKGASDHEAFQNCPPSVL